MKAVFTYMYICPAHRCKKQPSSTLWCPVSPTQLYYILSPTGNYHCSLYQALEGFSLYSIISLITPIFIVYSVCLFLTVSIILHYAFFNVRLLLLSTQVYIFLLCNEGQVTLFYNVHTVIILRVASHRMPLIYASQRGAFVLPFLKNGPAS